jgi:PAS domain S-box-containing protein
MAGGSHGALPAADAEAMMRRGIELLSTRSRQVLDAIAEGVYLLDAEGRTLFVNAEGARLLGYSARELIGQPQHALIHHSHPDGAPHLLEECPIHHAVREGVQQHVGGDAFWRKDGRPLHVDYTAIPIRDGRTIIGAVVTFRDASAEAEVARHATTLQREREARGRAERRLSDLQRLLEQVPAAISMTSGPEHRYIYQNTLARRMAGRDLCGRTAREAYPEMEAQGIFELLDQVYSSGEPWIGSAVKLRWDRDETGALHEGCFDISLQPLHDDEGRTIGVMSHAVETVRGP